MSKHISKNHGHWQLTKPLRTLLNEVKATENTRYAITGIYVLEGAIAVTDGRRLVEVQLTHTIPKGIYFLTEDGYILDNSLDNKFPKYKDIIPNKENLKRIVKAEGELGKTSGLVLGELVKAGCIVDLKLFVPPIEALVAAEARNIEVWVSKKDADSSPFMLECGCNFGLITYVQMLINVKNMT